VELKEKQEFKDLLSQSGLKPAEVARRLHCSRAHVSNICNFEMSTKPSDRLLKDMRLIVRGELADEHMEGMPRNDEPLELRDRMERLRELHSNDPAAFKAAASVIDQFSSKADAARRSLVKNAASKAKRVSPAPTPKPKADERSE
jgi:predicted XRE-type DNA-binding protein